MDAMDDHARAGGEISPEADDEFTVAQETEFDEVEPAQADEERPIDESTTDEVIGLDAERRVDLTEEPGSSSGTTE
jgi:hypothetical protein